MIDNTSNNEVELCGVVDSELSFSHEVYGEGFYQFFLNVPRLSDISDRVNITISERLLQDVNINMGETVCVSGQFRSYNNYSDSGNRLILTVFARDIDANPADASTRNPNHIFLNGFLCKKPVYRTTPFGREITDILIAVNRAYNKSDYIPCIAWGRNASYAAAMEVGEKICIEGRIQSRQYNKKDSEGNVTVHTAYEVSVIKIDEAEQADKDEII